MFRGVENYSLALTNFQSGCEILKGYVKKFSGRV